MDLQLIGIIGGGLILWWLLEKLCRSTDRKEAIPLGAEPFSAREVKKALERIGCVILDDTPTYITGLRSGDLVNWGQEISVEARGEEMLVKSTFVHSQIIGDGRNQENVDAFVREWDRRREFPRSGEDDGEFDQGSPSSNAISAVVFGTIWVLIGAFIMRFVIRGGFDPDKKLSSQLRLSGMASFALGYGLVKVRAGLARIRMARKR
jgi:hypothetical protein